MPWPLTTNFIGKSVGKICRKSLTKSIGNVYRKIYRKSVGNLYLGRSYRVNYITQINTPNFKIENCP